VLEKLAYVMANPVTAGLVRFAKDWPGLGTRPGDLGRGSFIAVRPALYLDSNNPAWPEQATLALTMPQGLGLSAEQVRRTVEHELRDLEAQGLATVRAKGWRFLGADRVRTASPYDRAKSWEPLRGRNPTFAVGRGQREAFFEAVATLRAFRCAYRRALERWRHGVRNALFPAGTWLMRWLHGAALATEP
jgi:hypothetical protein